MFVNKEDFFLRELIPEEHEDDPVEADLHSFMTHKEEAEDDPEDPAELELEDEEHNPAVVVFEDDEDDVEPVLFIVEDEFSLLFGDAPFCCLFEGS